MVKTYYYNRQIKKYLIQFMAIFQGMVVRTGKGKDGVEADLVVPVHYGSKDRVTAAILSENTQNKPIRLPTMSAYMSGIDLARNRFKGLDQIRRTSYVPLGGLLPDDAQVIYQLMPVPYNTTVDLTIYTSNQDQHFQILEQICMLFNPILQIQISDAAFDWTKITTVELKGINLEENYPAGTSRRFTVSTLSFEMPIYIAVPANIRDNLIHDIYTRIGVVTGNDLSADEILAEFDDQGLEYDLTISAEEKLPFE